MEIQFKEVRAKIDKALKKRIPNYLYCKFVIEYDYEPYYYLDIYALKGIYYKFEDKSLYQLKKEIIKQLIK